MFRSDKVGKTFKYTMPDGTVTSANGWFVAGTNEIWIDLNAGNAGEGTMIRTAAHEISHYIKQWSPQKWKAMADILMESFAKNNVHTESMLNRQIAKIKRRYTKKNMPSESIIKDMAYEELVSDALSDMLTDGSVVNFIAEVKAKDKNLAQKILDAIKSLLKKWGLIIDDYKGRDLDTPEARALSQLEDTFKKLQEMYRDAFADANEAYSAIGNVADGDIKNSQRDVDRKRKRLYNEYHTNAMQWAYSAATKTGDTKILNVNGKSFALLEAVEDGYIEIARGSYKEVLNYYEKMQRRADNSFYGNTQRIRTDKSGNMRSELFDKRLGRDVVGNSRQDGSKRLQTDAAGNNESLQSSDKEESNQQKINNSLRNSADSIKYSDRYWYPNMSKSELAYVKTRAKYEVENSNNYIDSLNKWLYNEKNGKTIFALYSTADEQNPTILYACKGKRAEFEHQFLIEYIVWEENDGDTNSTTEVIDRLLSFLKNPSSNGNVYSRNTMGRGSNNGNAKVYSKNSRGRPSEALLNCLRNIAEIQERNRGLKFSERDFSYDELVTKDDIQGVVIDKTQQPKIVNGIIDNNFVVKTVRSKCKSLIHKGGVIYYVNVPDIGTNVDIINDGITHGFARANDRRYGKSSPNAIINARVALEIPQILKNSIEVNRSQRGNNIDVPYTRVLIGTAALEDSNGVLEYYAVRSMVQERKNQNPILVEANVLGKLTSVNAKKIDSPNTQVGGNTVALVHGEAYTYKIADLLNDVKNIFDNTFSEDVYHHFGMARKEDNFSKNLLFSDREIEVYEDSIENYTETQYNNFGWASYNGVITSKEREILLSRYADYKHNKNKYPTTRFGEAVIHSAECPDVIMYVKGPISSPYITKIVRINGDVANVKEVILRNERENNNGAIEIVKLYFGEWILYVNRKRDYASFREYRAATKGSGSKSSNTSGGEQQNRTGSFTESEKTNKEFGLTKFSDRDSITTTRSILANALYSTAQNDIEKNKLAEYKEKIDLINAEEQRF